MEDHLLYISVLRKIIDCIFQKDEQLANSQVSPGLSTPEALRRKQQLHQRLPRSPGRGWFPSTVSACSITHRMHHNYLLTSQLPTRQFQAILVILTFYLRKQVQKG